MRAWMRQIEIILTSKKLKQKMVFGSYGDGKNDLYISITGSKHLSALKDNFIVQINNITYNEIVQMISGQFYEIEIKAGYREIGMNSIFKGSVLFISQSLGDKKTTVVSIICASKLVAAYGQSRINLSLNSGVNMYSAISFLTRAAGIANGYIDEDFKNRIINESLSISSTITSWLDVFTKSEGFVVSGDGVLGTDVSIWSPYRKDSRLLKLTSDMIILSGGYPQLTSQGLDITLLPTFGFATGDSILIDNSIIDISVSSAGEVNQNLGLRLDPNGKYLIFELQYNLTNRDSDFSVKMIAKSKGLITRVIGG